MSAKAHNIARQYFRRIGKSASSPECDTLGNCVSQLIDLGVFGAIQEMWIHRSAYNAGSGATSFGVLGRVNMSLVASPTWGVNGIATNGTTQYGTATLPVGLNVGSMIVIAGGNGGPTQPTAFATIGAIVSPTGRSTAVTGGPLSQLYHNNQAAVSTDSYNGTLSSDTVVALPSHSVILSGMRMFAFAADGGGSPSMANWIDTTKTAHATPRAYANNATIVTNAGNFDSPGYSLFYQGTVAMSLVFNVVISDAQMQAIYAILRKTIASGLPWVQTYTVEGDSQAAGAVADGNSWHFQLGLVAATYWYPKAYRNVKATGGQTSTQRLAAYLSAVYPSRPMVPEDRSWFTLCVGINDLFNDVTAEAVMANILAHQALARRDGFRTMQFTLPAHQTLTPLQETQRRRINDMIRGYDKSKLWDYMIDLGAQWPVWDTNYYLDATHLNIPAQLIICNLVTAKVPTP